MSPPTVYAFAPSPAADDAEPSSAWIRTVLRSAPNAASKDVRSASASGRPAVCGGDAEPGLRRCFATAGDRSAMSGPRLARAAKHGFAAGVIHRVFGTDAGLKARHG